MWITVSWIQGWFDVTLPGDLSFADFPVQQDHLLSFCFVLYCGSRFKHSIKRRSDNLIKRSAVRLPVSTDTFFLRHVKQLYLSLYFLQLRLLYFVIMTKSHSCNFVSHNVTSYMTCNCIFISQIVTLFLTTVGNFKWFLIIELQLRNMQVSQLQICISKCDISRYDFITCNCNFISHNFDFLTMRL